jgi:hypothetical protein
LRARDGAGDTGEGSRPVLGKGLGMLGRAHAHSSVEEGARRARPGVAERMARARLSGAEHGQHTATHVHAGPARPGRSNGACKAWPWPARARQGLGADASTAATQRSGWARPGGRGQRGG